MWYHFVWVLRAGDAGMQEMCRMRKQTRNIITHQNTKYESEYKAPGMVQFE